MYVYFEIIQMSKIIYARKQIFSSTLEWWLKLKLLKIMRVKSGECPIKHLIMLQKQVSCIEIVNKRHCNVYSFKQFNLNNGIGFGFIKKRLC